MRRGKSRKDAFGAKTCQQRRRRGKVSRSKVGLSLSLSSTPQRDSKMMMMTCDLFLDQTLFN